MKRLFRFLWAVGLSVAIIFSLAHAQEQPSESIPGVPDRCCGYQDCREAETALLELSDGKAPVSVDGVELEIERGAVVWAAETWYCRRYIDGPEHQDACAPPNDVRAECARCVVVAPGMAGLPSPLLSPPGGGRQVGGVEPQG